MPSLGGGLGKDDSALVQPNLSQRSAAARASKKPVASNKSTSSHVQYRVLVGFLKQLESLAEVFARWQLADLDVDFQLLAHVARAVLKRLATAGASQAALNPGVDAAFVEDVLAGAKPHALVVYQNHVSKSFPHASKRQQLGLPEVGSCFERRGSRQMAHEVVFAEHIVMVGK